MIPFFLFYVTAVSTALLTLYWSGSLPEGTTFLHAVHVCLRTSQWGGEQQLGFAGALIMMVAAYISAFTLWAGRCVAGLALAVVAIYCLSENVGVPPRRIDSVWVVLSLLLLVAAVVYVVGTFKVRGVQNVFFPRRASAIGQGVVWLFIVAPALCFVWWAFWGNTTQVRAVTVPAHWEPVTLNFVTSGRRQIKFSFTARDTPQSVTVASDDLFDALQSAQKQSVDVQIRETFKHGAMVAWNVETIDGSHDFTTITPLPQPTPTPGVER